MTSNLALGRVATGGNPRAGARIRSVSRGASGVIRSTLRYVADEFQMKALTKACFLLALISGSLNISFARCLESSSYAVTLKVNRCEEAKPGQVFIEGELLSVSKVGKTVSESQDIPLKGNKYVFYKALSPLVHSSSGQLKKREIGYCKGMEKQSVLKGMISRPCCDALYPWCVNSVEFLIDE